MFWNIRDAASSSFVSLTKSYKLSMVMILKPRINGFKVDEFIKKSGFDKFYRVEATGFSVGI